MSKKKHFLAEQYERLFDKPLIGEGNEPRRVVEAKTGRIASVGDVVKDQDDMVGKIVAIAPGDEWRRLKPWDNSGWMSDNMERDYGVPPEDLELYAIEFENGWKGVATDDNFDSGHMTVVNQGTTKYDEQYNNDGEKFSIIEMHTIKEPRRAGPYVTTSSRKLAMILEPMIDDYDEGDVKQWFKEHMRTRQTIYRINDIKMLQDTVKVNFTSTMYIN